MASQVRSLSRRRLLQLSGAAAGLAVAGSGLAACGSDSTTGGGGSTSIRFAFFGADDLTKRFQEACKLFTEKNPDIQVLPEFGASDAHHTKITVAMAAKNLPDVFWVPGDLLPQLIDNGDLMDLTPHLNAEGGISAEGFSESVLAPGKYDGKQWVMTHGLQSIGLFAKKAVLDELGIPVKKYPDGYTWEEYADYAAKIHQAKGAKFFGTDDPNTAAAGGFLRAYARQHGEDMWTTEGDLGFSEDTLRSWLTYWKKLRDDQSSVPTALALEQNPYFEGSPMIRGLSAYHMRNSNQLLALQTLTEDTITLMPCPGNGGKGSENVALDANIIGIAGNTKKAEAALKLVDFLLNDEDRAKIIGTTIGAPPTSRIGDAIKSSLTPPEAEFIEFINYETGVKSKPVPVAPPTAGAFQADFNKALQNLAYDKATIDETVALTFGGLRAKLQAK